MMRSLWISKTGMEAQQTQLDAISHNLANASTNGYKRSHAVFEDLMYQNLRQAGSNSTDQTTLPTGLQLGLGTRAVATSRSFSQGNLQQSSNPLDVAISGQGFFELQMPDGTTGYTRDGSFQVNATGQLVTNNGYTVQPGITIPAAAQNVTIGSDGTVSVTLAGVAENLWDAAEAPEDWAWVNYSGAAVLLLSLVAAWLVSRWTGPGRHKAPRTQQR